MYLLLLSRCLFFFEHHMQYGKTNLMTAIWARRSSNKIFVVLSSPLILILSRFPGEYYFSLAPLLSEIFRHSLSPDIFQQNLLPQPFLSPSLDILFMSWVLYLKIFGFRGFLSSLLSDSYTPPSSISSETPPSSSIL